jgi:apolipoprotein N-acyltransferase
MGLFYFAGTVHWVTNSVHFYGNIPLVPASLITLLLCAYLALYPATFGAAAVHLSRNHPNFFFVTAPALWTALELARTYVFSGFPWSLLGYSQYQMLPVIQVADITGVYGVSFLIVLVNTAVSEYLMNRKRYFGIVVTLVAMVLTLGYGFIKLRTPEGDSRITVSVVQGNIEQDKKWDSAYQAQTREVYQKLTREALKEGPDVVIWPETATPFYFGAIKGLDADLTADLRDFVRSTNTPLLTGSPSYEQRSDHSYILRNSAYLLDHTGATAATYHKIHLVPFGEYVPLKRVLFFVDKMVQAIGDFQSGDEYTVMTVPTPHGATKLGTVICYEIIFPDLVRRFVDRGVAVMTTVTNDAWFGRTAAPYQHFSMAAFRAVENRVPVARAANTGVSGFIDSKGNILAASDIFKEAHLTRRIVPGNVKTFYTKRGDVFSYACVIICLILLALPIKTNYR